MRSLLLALALTGCSHAAATPQWVCGDDGRIIYDRVPEDQQMEAISRNTHLTELRVRSMQGERWIDPDRLVKAEGCP